jgi:3-oxoacyl-[acyl-carrier-protein] synthase-3
MWPSLGASVTALAAVATYLPPRRVRVEELAGPLGLGPMQLKMFKRFQGFAEIRLDPGTLLDLLRPAAAAALEPLRGREHQVRYVVHARSMPVAVPYPLNPLRELCRELGLHRAVPFTVTHQACATGLLAVDLAGRLLAGDPDPGALALVLAGEKAFTRDAQIVLDTSVFGEAAAACLISRDGPADRQLSFATTTRGEFDGRLEDLPDVAVAYEQEYKVALAETMLAAVARAGLSIEDISLILPHNVNDVSWRRLARRLRFPIDQVVLDNVPVTGHAFCADLFFNYATARASGRLRPGDRYLVAAAGQGATFSAMVFEH